MNVLLLSTYSLGHQPLDLARPAAHLIAAGHDVCCQDLSIDRLDESLVRSANLVGISVPMHTATRLGLRLSERIRAINPRCHVSFYGLYASLNAGVLLGRFADSVIGGEFEGPLVELAGRLATDDYDRNPLVGVISDKLDGGVSFERQNLLLPRREELPPLDRYARVETGADRKVVGYTEASRGCAHRCLHCPITPVYAGRMRIVPADIVLEDVRQLVAMGAQHITFGDPDFFNGIRHSLRIVDSMHDEFPTLTYDATIKVEHILEHRQHIERLAQTGCLFVVSAVEAVQDHILANLEKGHSAADVDQALAITRGDGIHLRPTFVAFTPWTSLDDYLELLEFVADRGLIYHVDAVQFVIRLLVPLGSSLLGTAAMQAHLDGFDGTMLSYAWRHPDPRMDELQRQVSALVEAAAATGDDASLVFERIYRLAAAMAGRQPIAVERVGPSVPVPRLTEPWFC